ncbi:hypothetical protein CBS101457_003472 [Exobasidium rhododendri]|nr:hypothetical protein CBS101457_003472 [Exobasidium rhododendri]
MVSFLDYFWPETTEHGKVKMHSVTPTHAATTQNDAPTSNSVALLACTIAGLALAAKTIRSSTRARHACHEARAWRKVSMALLRREGQGESLRPRTLRAHQLDPTSKSLVEGAQEAEEGGDKIAASSTSMRPGNWHSSYDVESDTFRTNSATEEGKGTAFNAAKVHAAPPSHSVKLPSTRSLYSAVHPHEDWDWTPADHPRPTGSWRRSRLPPWTIGITSSPNTPSTPSPEIQVEANTVGRAPGGDTPQSNNADDWMLRSMMWSNLEPLCATEAAFIADEVYRETAKELRSPTSSANQTKPAMRVKRTMTSPKDDPSKIQALEAQIWALLSRQQALEDKLRDH